MTFILPALMAVLFFFAPTFPLLERLLPSTSETIPFHTPAYVEGMSLPSRIEGSLTIGPENGVILIHSMVTIPKASRLTIKPGTHLAVSEFAGIRIVGSLEATGTPDSPILFTSNELNENNKHWNGILFESGSTGSVHNTIFHHASPSVSCVESSSVTTAQNTYLFGNLATYGSC